MVRFEGSGRHAELGRNDIYPEADIAWAGNEGVFGFDNSFDLMRASSRPAAPPAPDARRPRRRR